MLMDSTEMGMEAETVRPARKPTYTVTAGLTVSASIPISVLSISILRKLGGYLPPFGRPTILENNIVQTTGSAGESLAAGVMFTIPALLFLGFGSEFTFWRIFPLALLGGWLGVLFMVPLRRQLIVKE